MDERKMKKNPLSGCWCRVARLILISVCAVSAISAPRPAFGQTPNAPVLPGCSQPLATRVAVYDFLAYLAYRDFQQGKYAESARVARALEFIWDETSGCMAHFGVSAEETGKIDELMDIFVKPLEADSNKDADPKKVVEAYQRYIDELKASGRPPGERTRSKR